MVPSASRDNQTRARLRQIPASGDGEAFAQSVARALFDWDTTVPAPVSDYTGRLLAVAASQESPALIGDLAGYLPASRTWAFLKPYATRQWLEIGSASPPKLWSRALAQASPGDLAAGTTAYTIRGIRHRAGVWQGVPVAAQQEVAFTVFLVCAPTYPTCRLLRLSRPDEPLE